MVHVMWLKGKLTTGVIKAPTRDITADIHTKRPIKRTTLQILKNVHYKAEYERETLQLYTSPDSRSSQARSLGSPGSPSCPELPPRRWQTPTRPARTLLLTMAPLGESLELGPFDNPFVMLGMRRTSFERSYKRFIC